MNFDTEFRTLPGLVERYTFTHLRYFSCWIRIWCEFQVWMRGGYGALRHLFRWKNNSRFSLEPACLTQNDVGISSVLRSQRLKKTAWWLSRAWNCIDCCYFFRSGVIELRCTIDSDNDAITVDGKLIIISRWRRSREGKRKNLCKSWKKNYNIKESRSSNNFRLWGPIGSTFRIPSIPRSILHDCTSINRVIVIHACSHLSLF